MACFNRLAKTGRCILDAGFIAHIPCEAKFISKPDSEGTFGIWAEFQEFLEGDIATFNLRNCPFGVLSDADNLKKQRT